MPGKLFSPVLSSVDDDDDDDDIKPRKAPSLFRVFAEPQTSTLYSVYMSTGVGAPQAYDDLCHLLRTLPPQDKVRLYLNTTGGSMAAGLAIIEAMRASQAHITTILNPEAYSMGALLFLAGDDFEVPPNGRLMFHNYSSGMVGKGNEQVAEVQSSIRWFEQVMYDVCYPFLSKAEIKAVLQGRDFWLDAADITKRFEEIIRKQQAARRPR